MPSLVIALRALLLVLIVLVVAAAPLAEAKKEGKGGKEAPKHRPREASPAAPFAPMPDPALVAAPEPPWVAAAPTSDAGPATGDHGALPPTLARAPHAAAGASLSSMAAAAPFWLGHVPFASLAVLGFIAARSRRPPLPAAAPRAEGDPLELNIARVRANPFDGGARFDLGVLLLRQGQAERAMPQLARAFTLDPSNVLRLLEDPEFAPLLESPEIRELLELVRRAHADRVLPGYA